MDGTLVDSRLDFAAIRRETGFPEETGLLEHLETLRSPEARARAAAIIHRHEMAGAAAATWMPGAQELLGRLVLANVPIGIVTRNSREATEYTLKALSAPPLDTVTREDTAPKPDPAGLLLMANNWGILPMALLYVGDFLFDLQAAKAAGMKSALYTNHRNGVYRDQADLVFEHFDQLAETLLPTPS